MPAFSFEKLSPPAPRAPATRSLHPPSHQSRHDVNAYAPLAQADPVSVQRAAS